jgi:hypothetical protein
MRKTLVIVLALAALSFAADTWIGYGPKAISALPVNSANPIPQVLPPGGNDRPNTDTIKLDDNAVANAWAWNGADNGFGVKFMLPANPVNLAGALINLYANTWPVPGGNRFKVKVFQGDGPGGAPGTELWASGDINGTRGAWNYVPIGTAIIDYDFYIFYIQPDTFPACPGMSMDARYNSPTGFQWDLVGGSFSPSNRIGDWLIRAVIDWTPQTNNVGPLTFSNLPFDTIPNINLTLQATFKNYGTATQNPGVPVKMHIDGPLGYSRDFLTDTTPGTWPYRGTKTITFHPTWHVPDTAGQYILKVWSDLATDEYRGNDTMVRVLGAARWLTYANWASPYWITWAGPQRAMLIHPADFGVDYPLEITRLRTEFYYHTSAPWDDSIFQYAIYAENGDSLWESDTVRAVSNVPMETQVSPPVALASGDFYIAVVPRGYNGYPSSFGNNAPPSGHSYYGSPGGGWMPWSNGELFFACVAKTVIPGAVGEGHSALDRPGVSVVAMPNPGPRTLISWQIQEPGPVRIVLYDAAGREVRCIYESRGSQALSGSIRLDTGALPSGIYLLKLTAGNSSARTKLVINR